jgi:hypothetical protein
MQPYQNQEILDQIEFSLALLEPPALQVKPMSLSFKNGWFSGIWTKYQPKGSLESLDMFIPHNELKPPYHLRTASEDLVKSQSLIEVYPLRIDINKHSRDSRKWQIPIGTMFSPADRATAVTEAEDIKSVNPDTEEMNIKEGTIIEMDDVKLEVVGAEYHYDDGKRPKAVIFRITASSKYPILRMEQEQADFKQWENLLEHSDRKSSKTIRRFFYKKQGKNTLKIGEIQITLFPIFSGPEQKRLQREGYVGKLRIVHL